MANGFSLPTDFLRTNRVHFVGIAGSGMKSLARLLAASGWYVTGSDASLPDAALNSSTSDQIRRYAGHHPSHVADDIDLVIHSLAIPETNPECRRADELGIPRRTYPQALSEISKTIPTLAIAGTHGKTTTTAIISWILFQTGQKVAHVFGGEFVEGCPQTQLQNAELFVVEACEFRQSLLELHPVYGIVLNEDADHFDCYPTLEETRNVFQEFRQRLESKNGLVRFQDWSAQRVCVTNYETGFDGYDKDQFIGAFSVPVFGNHNLQNALAAIAVCHRLGVDVEQIQNALKSFPGVRRRLQNVGSPLAASDVMMFDDYAHHPTAVAYTLETLRTRFPGRRVICVFQPHQIRRTRELMTEFSKSFQDADDVFLVPIFAAREKTNGEEFTVCAELARRIEARGQSVTFVPSLDQIWATLDHACCPGDVVVTMGAGDIERIHDDGTGRIQRYHAS